MQATKSFTAEIKPRGQLTIPKRIREMSHLEEGQAVSIIPVGDAVIITPKRLELDEARREIRRILGYIPKPYTPPEADLAAVYEEVRQFSTLFVNGAG